MRSVDERPVAAGGGGAAARPLLAADRGGIIDRHGLWGPAQYAAAGQLRRVADELGLTAVRFSFADQHGVLRGKTIAREAVGEVLRSGLTAPSSLLLKDTSGASVFPVFASDPGVGVAGLAGAGDIVLVPDPTTFRVLPWSERTGWVLCDVRFPDGSAVPLCTRSLLRSQLHRLAGAGYDLTVGVELEFHVLGSDGAPLTRGGQLLHEEGLDRLDQVVQVLRAGLSQLDLPVRSLELEFGPGQLEVTLSAADAARAADDVILLRAAVRQLCRRHGFHATFMSRPAGSQTASTGWHLHQSLRDRATGEAAFGTGDVSDVARHWLGGLLAHARAASAFTTPTVNGYKRFRPFSLAPDRVVWGMDNKGAMVRVAGMGSDTGLRLENRSGEPAANPYLYLASQVVSGLAGLAARSDPGPPVAEPYTAAAPALPGSLGEALDALAGDPVFAEALGPAVVDWYVTIKRAEFARYLAHVSDWEQHEYLDLV